VHDELRQKGALIGLSSRVLRRSASATTARFPGEGLRENPRSTRTPSSLFESPYSVNGNFPHLPRLIAIKRRYGAWLTVDQIHSLGFQPGARHRRRSWCTGRGPPWQALSGTAVDVFPMQPYSNAERFVPYCAPCRSRGRPARMATRAVRCHCLPGSKRALRPSSKRWHAVPRARQRLRAYLPPERCILAQRLAGAPPRPWRGTVCTLRPLRRL
jgi:hypothetical protein